MKKFLTVFLSILMITSLVACGNSTTTTTTGTTTAATTETTNENTTTDKQTENNVVNTTPEVETTETEKVTTEITFESTHTATINVKDYGTIVVALDGNTAPITVENFVKLAKEGFYDGLTFHRIIDGFMIQGGDPLGNGTGDSGTDIKGEFSENGVENNISHKRGTISMARASDPNSGSCQFFIVHEDSQFLDGSYAGFGYVISGMEVVDAICDKVEPIDNNGTVLPLHQPIIESITID